MSKEKIIDYLHFDFTDPIRDSLWQNILLPSNFIKIINTTEFQRLSHIKQLGPTYQVYPGATHTRLNHSLGVYHIALKIVKVLVEQRHDKLFSLEGVKAFLLAALLHDLGHFPYTHSLKELPLKEHETITAELILDTQLKDIIRNSIGTDPELVAAIVDDNLSLPNDEIKMFRGMLSGVLDPDKLDYLNRDAFFSGVPYGLQDVDFTLNQIVPHKEYGLGIKENGLTSIENILFSKYLMYKTVYWHRTVRTATAMIKKSLVLGLQEEALKADELYYLDDEQFYRVLSSKPFEPFELIERVFNRDFYKIAFECDFSENTNLFKQLENMTYRMEVESKLASILNKKFANEVKPKDVIIDIPERINFEIDLPVLIKDEFISFQNLDSIFSGHKSSSFTSSLRKVRILVPSHIIDKIDKEYKWLDLLKSQIL